MSGEGEHQPKVKAVECPSKLRRSKRQAAREIADSYFTTPPGYYPWHADHEHRRTKTLAELEVGLEHNEIAARRERRTARRAK